MKITFPRSELKAAVAGFQKIVNGKSRNLPILGCIRFEADAAGGTVTAHATDLDQFLTYSFQQAQTEEAGVLILPLTTLKDLSKGQDEESVEFACTGDKEYAVSVTNHVGAHVIQHSVPGFDLAEWPSCPPKTPTRPATGFLDAYRSMLPFVSCDETRRVLTGVYIEKGTGNACTLVATDGRRLTCRRNLELPVARSVVVPATKFLSWSVLPGEACIGLRTEKDGKTTRVAGFVLQTGPWRYDTRTTDGVYPNWRQVVPPGDSLTQRIVFHEDDVGLMRRILPTFPGGQNVTVACGADGSVTLAGSDKESGEETRLPLQVSRHTGNGARICLDRVFLQEAFDAGFRDFGFADSLSPLAAEDSQGGVHVLMPLKIGAVMAPPAQEKQDTPDTQAASDTAKATEPAPVVAAETSHQPTPAAETQPANPKEKTMSPENPTEQTALEKLQAAYDVARSRVREAQSALSDVAAAIRDAVREDRQRRSEVENVRAGLARLQSIKV